MLAQVDLHNQRTVKQQLELSREIKALEKSIIDGTIVPIVEKYVISFVEREKEKEPEARFQHTSNEGGSGTEVASSGMGTRESGMIADEIKIIQNNIKGKSQKSEINKCRAYKANQDA